MSTVRLEFSQVPVKGGLWLPGLKGNAAKVCDSRYLRECVKEIGDHFQSRLSPGLMFVTRARRLDRLISIF